MARVNKANFKTYRDGETVTASEFNKIKDIFPEAINHIEDTLRDGQRLVDIENVNKEQDERLDSHDEQQAQTDQHLEQLDTRCDEQDEVLADHETRITTATSENSRQDEVIHNINERLREVEDNNADIKIVTVFANNIQKVETFVASEGQQEFQLQKGHYIPGQNRIQMFVDGVQQTLDDGFMEVSSRTIRFTEPLKSGMKVTAHYFTEEASDDLTEIMETIKEGPAILEGLIQNGESRVNEFIQSGETTINGFLSEGEREVEELVTKGENAFDNLVQRAEQVKADSILVQPTKPKPSDNCDIWFDTSEDDFLTLQDYEEARNQAFNNQMATFESRFSEIKGEKGDKGEPGVGVLESDFKDYMGDVHETLRAVHKANVDYTIRTAVGEFNHLDYEGQHITATNTIEGHVKSAILKGRTLVNLIPKGRQSQFDVNNIYGGGTAFWELTEHHSTIKPSTKYLVIVNVTFNSGSQIVVNNNEGSVACFKDSLYIEPNEVGCFKWIVTSKDDLSNCTTILRSYTARVGQVIGTMQVLEYQEGMENWDIPFFTGMASVKMPVLKTTGKNLFDYKSYGGQDTNVVEIENGLRVSGWAVTLPFTHNLLPNTTYTSKSVMTVVEESVGATDVGTGKILMYNGTTYLSLFAVNGSEYTFTTPSDIKSYDRILFYAHGGGGSKDGVVDLTDMQLEETSSATPYAPFKSNILTVNEPVELRRIGDVQDELNLLTGELTQRIGEVVLDGSELWTQGGSQSEGFVRFYAPPTNKKHATSKVMSSDITPYNGITPYGVVGYENITGYSHNIHLNVNIKKDRIGVTDLTNAKQNAELFKLWLSQNPITVQYELETPIIKTVDLSDNVVYSYDEITHYDGSSEDGSLIPTLAVKVPTDVQAVITDQSATIQTLEQENQALKKTQDTLLVVQLGMMEHIATTLAESEEQPTYLKALRQLASERGLL